MKNKGWLTIFVWICGYGAGLLNASQYIEDPIVMGTTFIIGAILFVSGWFWHYMQKPNGGIDKITDRIMLKKYGATNGER